MSGIVGSRLNTRGSGVVGSLGTDGQILASSGAGKGAVFETISVGGDLSMNRTVFGGDYVDVDASRHQLTIDLNQSSIKEYIKNDGSALFNKLLPIVTFYDQSDNAVGVKDSSENTSNFGVLNGTSYEWQNYYDLSYSAIDISDNETIVDVSFQIIDDIYPVLTLTDENENDNVSGYFNFSDISGADNTNIDMENRFDIVKGKGRELSTEFHDISWGGHYKGSSIDDSSNVKVYIS